MLDQMAHKHTNTTGKTSHSSALTGEENPRKHGREDPKLSSTPGDKKYDAWPDDWCEPALELLVDVQRGPQNSSIVLAKLFVRMWFTGEAPLYVLTFAKPIMSPSSGNFSSPCQVPEEDARKAKKHATLDKMKSGELFLLRIIYDHKVLSCTLHLERHPSWNFRSLQFLQLNFCSFYVDLQIQVKITDHTS
jgi:hypothetical protein